MFKNVACKYAEEKLKSYSINFVSGIKDFIEKENNKDIMSITQITPSCVEISFTDRSYVKVEVKLLSSSCEYKVVETEII